MFVQHDFKVLEDIWFTIAPELTVQSVEVCNRSPYLVLILSFTMYPSLFPASHGQLPGASECGPTDRLVLITR